MPTAEKVIDALGTGRRKTSVARVRIRAGSGKLTINERELAHYFPVIQDQNAVVAPLEHGPGSVPDGPADGRRWA